MGDVSGRSIAVDHAQRRIADVRKLVKYAARDVDGLSGPHHRSFLTEAHFACALDDEVDLLLVLIMPGDLPTVGIECDISHGKVGRLDWSNTADEVLCQSACWVAAA